MTSRHGNKTHENINNANDGMPVANQAQKARPELPDWLKVPQAVLDEQRSETTDKKPERDRSHLRLVVNNTSTGTAPAARPGSPAAKPTAPAKPVKAKAAAAKKPAKAAAKTKRATTKSKTKGTTARRKAA